MIKNLSNKLREKRADQDLSTFDLYSIDNLSDQDLELIFKLAKEFKKNGNQKYDLLTGTTIFNLFFENSTRTKSSFELAGKKLGADVINVSGNTTSVKKGESYLDTAETVGALNANTIVIRSAQAGVQQFIAKHIPASIINAGDGWHEHPSQALLDLFTIEEEFSSVEGKIVTVLGDILHSRVFGSLARLLTRMGAKLRVAAPETFFPVEIAKLYPLKLYYNADEAISGADVVYTLRVQSERGAKGFIPTIREYSKTFGVNARRFALAKKSAILMHPGPVIRDVDIASELMRHERNRILQQVNNGLFIRLALLWLFTQRVDQKTKSFIPA